MYASHFCSSHLSTILVSVYLDLDWIVSFPNSLYPKNGLVAEVMGMNGYSLF